MIKIRLTVVATTALLSLVGCGGGGGETGAAPQTPSTTTFPLLAAYKTATAAGGSVHYSVTGSCTGSATISDAPTVPANFEGEAGFSQTTTATFTFSNCTPATVASTDVIYYDANYTPLGSSTPGEEYGKLQTPPVPLPASAKIGDSASFGTLTLYSDSTKAVVTGSRVMSYVIEPDTATTAFANLIAKDYDVSNQLICTQQTRYRIGTDGTFAPSSIDAQCGSMRLLLTKI